MKVLVIGAVGTTLVVTESLIKHNFRIVGLLGHEPKNKNRVSGLIDLKSYAELHKVPYKGFISINDPEIIAWAQMVDPDIIFAVGFSQLLSKDWFSISKHGCVGFHPTLLPEGRGRAPVAWTILEKRQAAATFFQMTIGADDGPIYVQQPFSITDDDDAESLVPKIREAISKALDKWLPELLRGNLNAIAQDSDKATYYGKREPCDSLIDWRESAEKIDRLIKASTRPHPGSFTFVSEKIVTIWKSHVNMSHRYKGVVGRVLLIENNSFLVQCGNNTTIWIDEYDLPPGISIKVGDKFGNLEQNLTDAMINNYVWQKTASTQKNNQT